MNVYYEKLIKFIYMNVLVILNKREMNTLLKVKI